MGSNQNLPTHTTYHADTRASGVVRVGDSSTDAHNLTTVANVLLSSNSSNSFLRIPPIRSSYCSLLFSFLPVFLGKTSFSHPLFLLTCMIFALLFPCLGSSVPHAPSIPSLVKLFSPGASLRLFLLQLRITSSPIYPACFSSITLH